MKNMKKYHINFTHKESGQEKSDSLILGAKSSREIEAQLNQIVDLIEIQKIQEV